MMFAVLYVTGLFILTLLLSVGGFILQRERYWIRIWKELGKPDVRNIRELKSLYRQALTDRVPNCGHSEPRKDIL
jgi:hypothetical protein